MTTATEATTPDTRIPTNGPKPQPQDLGALNHECLTVHDALLLRDHHLAEAAKLRKMADDNDSWALALWTWAKKCKLHKGASNVVAADAIVESRKTNPGA